LVTPIFILNLKNAIIKSHTFVCIFIKYYFYSSHFFIVFPKVQFTIIICGLVFIYVCFTLFSSSISISQQFIIFILIALISYFAVFTNFILISCFFLFSIFHCTYSENNLYFMECMEPIIKSRMSLLCHFRDKCI
jgi:hypothetical protein